MPKGYSDFRKMYENKDIQGVVVATPDHWHALLTIMACAAGKDVYVEKPMTVFIDEGKWMIQAARKYNRIVVVGTQRRQGKGVAAAKKVIESGQLGKIHSIRIASYRNIYPGFGKTPVSDPPPEIDYDMWLGPGPQEAVPEAPRPVPLPLVLGLLRRPDDQPGRAHHRPGAVVHEREGPDHGDVHRRPVRAGRRRRDARHPGRHLAFPGGFTVNYAIREANAMRGDTATRGQVYLGTKGNLVLAGGYEVIPENKIDPVNDIPRFMGHPIGGPVYTDVKPTPWIQASKGGVESDARYGTGGEDTMAMNERDWLNCMRSRKRPLCEVEDGHRVAMACHLANMSLRIGRAIKWDPDKEQVIGDKEAAAMCYKPYRAPWDGVLKSLVKV